MLELLISNLHELGLMSIHCAASFSFFLKIFLLTCVFTPYRGRGAPVRLSFKRITFSLIVCADVNGGCKGEGPKARLPLALHSDRPEGPLYLWAE